MQSARLVLNLVAICWVGLITADTPSLAGAAGGSTVSGSWQNQASNMKARIVEERDREIQEHTDATQRKIQKVNECAEMDIAKVPKVFYNGWGYAIPNPDYDRTVAYIRVDAEKQMNVINRDLTTTVRTIKANYQEKLNAVDDSMGNIVSQIKPGNSDIQLTPEGSSMYVHNYVNYGVEKIPAPAPVGLKARQKALANKTTRSQ